MIALASQYKNYLHYNSVSVNVPQQSLDAGIFHCISRVQQWNVGGDFQLNIGGGGAVHDWKEGGDILLKPDKLLSCTRSKQVSRQN